MNIKGLQKLTILDFPERIAATIFVGGCNFRCPFCHNYELLSSNDKTGMSESEVLYFLKSRRGLLSGVVISGGEPTLQHDLVDFAKKVKDLGFLIKLDTNGTRPDVIKRLISDELISYIAMDVKNSIDKYPITANVNDPHVNLICNSINLIMREAKDYEFRTTVIDGFHEESDFHKIGEMIQGAKRHFIQAFVDRDTVPYAGLKAPSFDELETYRNIMTNYVERCEIR